MRSANEWSVNANDPTNEQYSILDTLENFRAPDGKFRFKLEWVLEGSTAPVQPQTWQQTSNPVTATNGGVTGYQAGSVPYAGCYWGGLERNTAGFSLLDGSVDHSNYWFAVGTILPYGGYMPGPCGSSARVTELYAYL